MRRNELKLKCEKFICKASGVGAGPVSAQKRNNIDSISDNYCSNVNPCRSNN